jgi:hypothetical protein
MMSDDEPFSRKSKPLPQREPQPGEPLWTRHKGSVRVTCELHSHAERGCEIQLYRNGGFYSGRFFKRREQALAYAKKLNRDLQAQGWTVEP